MHMNVIKTMMLIVITWKHIERLKVIAIDKQLDIFGNEVDIDSIQKTKKGGRKPFKRMQEIHGVDHRYKCKQCEYFTRKKHHMRTYLKCSQWIQSHSSATDIKANDEACRIISLKED